jgi:hypothetical protein
MLRMPAGCLLAIRAIDKYLHPGYSFTFQCSPISGTTREGEYRGKIEVAPSVTNMDVSFKGALKKEREEFCIVTNEIKKGMHLIISNVGKKKTILVAE